MRGEHLGIGSIRRTRSGSSPHARGARWKCSRTRCFRRIIPACAGSTSSRSERGVGYQDHPRMRGEHSSRNGNGQFTTGSSPHARGALGEVHVGRRDRRIIPACAGSTPSRRRRGGGRGDHPRMRGEHLPVGVEENVGGRIIPACAGSTPHGSAAVTPAQDHPRMRGEHGRAGRVCGVRAGSSPHARGALRGDGVPR